jgi:hypothetical protein
MKILWFWTLEGDRVIAFDDTHATALPREQRRLCFGGCFQISMIPPRIFARG